MGFSCAESRFRPSLSSQTKRGRGEAEARSERPRPPRRHIHLMLPKNLGILRGHGSFSPVERETTNEERTKGKRDEMRRDTREGTMKTKARRERERSEVLTKLRGENIPPAPAHSARPQSRRRCCEPSRHPPSAPSVDEVKYFFSIMITSVFHFSPASLFPLSLARNRRRGRTAAAYAAAPQQPGNYNSL